MADEPSPSRARHPLRRALAVLGPGLITGASDDDPSGIGTYAVAGASLGYGVLWLAPLVVPLVVAVQFTCAKIGLVTGRGLASVLRHHYPGWVLYPAMLALAVANTINAGAVAEAVGMLVPVPAMALVVPIGLAVLALLVWGSYRLVAGTFKWLTLALFAYVGAGVLARPDPLEVLRATFVPALGFDRVFLATLVAVLGTTISPYLLFWQASQEVEEEVHMGRTRLRQRRGATAAELRRAALDTSAGMLFAVVVMYFIMLATAATLYQAGQRDVQTAAEAAEALRPLAGDAARLLLALGLIGSGLLAIPVLTGSAAYAVCEALGRRAGLDEKPGRARLFYAVIVLAILVGVELNMLGVNPIAALFWTAVLNGLLAPPLLVVVLLVANNRAVMGAHVNGRTANALGVLATGAMLAAALGLILTWVTA